MEAWTFDYHGYLALPVNYNLEHVIPHVNVMVQQGEFVLPHELNTRSTGQPVQNPYATISNGMSFYTGDLIAVRDGDRTCAFVATRDVVLRSDENILDHPDEFVLIDYPEKERYDTVFDPIQNISNLIHEMSVMSAEKIEEDPPLQFALFISSEKLNIMASRHIASVRGLTKIDHYVKACYYHPKNPTFSGLTVVIDDEFSEILSKDHHMTNLNPTKRELTPLERRILNRRVWNDRHDTTVYHKMILREEKLLEFLTEVPIDHLQVILRKVCEMYDTMYNTTHDDIPKKMKTGDRLEIASVILDKLKNTVSLEEIDTLEKLGCLPKGIFWAIFYMFIYRYYGNLCPAFTLAVQYSVANELQRLVGDKLEEYGFKEIIGWAFV